MVQHTHTPTPIRCYSKRRFLIPFSMFVAVYGAIFPYSLVSCPLLARAYSLSLHGSCFGDCASRTHTQSRSVPMGAPLMCARKCRRPGCDFDLYGVESGPLDRKDVIVATYNVPRASVPIHYPLTLARVLGLALSIAWGGFLTLVACGKLVLQFGGVGYVKYMTNWSWTAQAFYFDIHALLTLFSIIRETLARKNHTRPKADVAMLLHYEMFYLTVLMAVTGVFFGLIVVLYYAPELLSENFETVGEGLTYGGNAVVHYIPPIMFALHTLAISEDLRHVFAKSVFGLAWGLVRACLVGTICAAVYCAAFSPGSVYNLPDTAVTLAASTAFVLSALLVSVYVVLILSPMGSTPLTHPIHRIQWTKERMQRI